jgi:heme/copper-type cytochrome/quinol oxidase subunit 1
MGLVLSGLGTILGGVSFVTWKYREQVTMDDPWRYGNSLEWATSCPPSRHNFTRIPRIRSARPACGAGRQSCRGSTRGASGWFLTRATRPAAPGTAT